MSQDDVASYNRDVGNTSTSGVASSGQPRSRVYVYNQIFVTLRLLIKLGAAALYIHLLLPIAKVLAGHKTSLVVSVLFSVVQKTQSLVELSAFIVLVLWATMERTLRKRNIRRWHPRIKELETMLDQDRSTSTLTPSGETNPKDRED